MAAEMDRRLEGGESGRLRFTYTDLSVATDVRRDTVQLQSRREEILSC